MLTLNEIRNVNFRKSNFGGYRAEDVEAFIDEVQLSYDSLLKENAELLKRLESLTAKLEQYQQEEDSIRNALMNAQKVGDASLRDAKHKAEIILKDATIKAEKIVSNAQIEIHRERDVIEKMQRDIADFKARLLKVYKDHLTLINNIPNEDIMRQDTKDALSSVPMLDRDTSPYASQAGASPYANSDYAYANRQGADNFASQNSFGGQNNFGNQTNFGSQGGFGGADNFGTQPMGGSNNAFGDQSGLGGSDDSFNGANDNFGGQQVGGFSASEPQQDDYSRPITDERTPLDFSGRQTSDFNSDQPIMPHERLNHSRGGFTVNIDDDNPSTPQTTTLPPPMREQPKYNAFDGSSSAYTPPSQNSGGFDRSPIGGDNYGSYNSPDTYGTPVGTPVGNDNFRMSSDNGGDFSTPAYDTGTQNSLDNAGFFRRR